MNPGFSLGNINGKRRGKGLVLLGLSLLMGAILCSCSIFPKMKVIKDPLDQNEHLTLGMAYEKDAQLDLAEREYELALPLPEAQLSLGNLYFMKGEPKKAEQLYRKCLAQERNPKAANNLAFLYVTEGRNLSEAYRLATIAVEEGIKRSLPEENIREFKATLNQAETALSNSKKDKGKPK
jgi:tetratricopeptide (TPR) repeat protein